MLFKKYITAEKIQEQYDKNAHKTMSQDPDYKGE